MSDVYVYIAGPMRGIPWFNFDAFYAAEEEVFEHFKADTCRVNGVESQPGLIEACVDTGSLWWNNLVIFNPARYDHDTHGYDVNPESGDLADIPGSFSLRTTLGRDLEWIAHYATHLYMLAGWQNSKGARAEKALAEALGIEVLYQAIDGVIPVQATWDVDVRDLDVRFAVPDTSGIWEFAYQDPKSDGTGEVRTTSSSGGEKGVKPARYDLIPAGPLKTLAELYGKGAEKYADRNWENGYEWSKSFAALNRHLWAFWSGEDNDPEHTLPHLASVAWHAFAMMEWMNTHPEHDNRPKG